MGNRAGGRNDLRGIGKQGAGNRSHSNDKHNTTMEKTMNKVTRADKRRIMFRAAMVAGVVRFSYRKTDGTIRQALGTLSGEIVPATQGAGKANDAIQVYYDTECGAWRSFRVANLIDVAE